MLMVVSQSWEYRNHWLWEKEKERKSGREGMKKGKKNGKQVKKTLFKMERQQKVKENHFFGVYFICQTLFGSLDMVS